MDRWLRQPSHPYSPVHEGPQGAGLPLLAVGLPLTRAQCLPMSSRARPRLGPLSIADRIAQHEHAIDVLSTPAHARSF